MSTSEEKLLEFFEYIWGEDKGQVSLATIEHGSPKPRQYMLDWPLRKKQIISFVLSEDATGKDIYFRPAVFKSPDEASEHTADGKTRPTRDNVKGANVLWVDIDGYKSGQSHPPEDWPAFCKDRGIPEPSLIVRPSVQASQHVYWGLDEFTPTEVVETLNRNLAAVIGADLSGWDGNQLLRVPYTKNQGWRTDTEHKEWYTGKAVEATILHFDTSKVSRATQFSELAQAEKELIDRLQVKLTEDLPTLDAVKVQANWSDELYAQFSLDEEGATKASPDKRSGSLQKLAYLAVESGMSDEQIFVILDDADTRWGKYAKRSSGARHKELIKIIARGRAKLGYITEDLLTFSGLAASVGQDIEGTTPKLIYRWDEFIEAEFDIKWLIEGLLSEGGYGVVTGQPGVGKTQFGLQWAISMALGRSILGHSVSGGARKGLMFSLEMNKESLHHFANKVDQAYPGERSKIGKNLGIIPLGRPIDILSKEGFKYLDAVLAQEQPDFVYIDSLKKIMGKSLNDDEAIRNMNDALQVLRSKHRAAFYVIHHDRKKPSGGAAVGDLNDMYGSQYIAAEADSVLSLIKSNEKNVVRLEYWKTRLEEEPSPLWLKRTSNIQFEEHDKEAGDDGIRIIGATNGSKKPDSDQGGRANLFG